MGLNDFLTGQVPGSSGFGQFQDAHAPEVGYCGAHVSTPLSGPTTPSKGPHCADNSERTERQGERDTWPSRCRSLEERQRLRPEISVNGYGADPGFVAEDDANRRNPELRGVKPEHVGIRLVIGGAAETLDRARVWGKAPEP